MNMVWYGTIYSRILDEVVTAFGFDVFAYEVIRHYILRFSFYRAMLCIRGTSHGPVSVCLSVSVTSRNSTKTAKQRITQTTPHDSPGTLVF